MKMLKSIEEVPTRREMRTLDRMDANTTAGRLEDMTEIIIDRLEDIMGITTVAQTTDAITTTVVAMETVDMETATVDHTVETTIVAMTITVLMVTDETIDLSEETVMILIDQTTVTEMIMNTNNNNKKRKMADMMRHPSRWVENLLKTTIRNITSVDRQIKKIAK